MTTQPTLVPAPGGPGSGVVTTHLPLRAELPPALPALRRRALKLTRNEAEAADLVQDTVERALRFEASYRPGTNARAWLQQVLFSVFVTRCRRRRREKTALEVLTDDPNAWTSPEAPAVLPGLSRSLERALDDLPAAYAAVIRLVDIGELAYKDAAGLLEVPVGTVMSRLFRGRRLLAERLAATDPVATPIAAAA